jgi:polyadenylate-binding protein
MNKYKGLNLYVRNLDETVTDAKLKEEFGKYGTILSAKVMKNDKEVSKGFGFVCFTTPEEATKATELSGKLVWGKPLYVAPAQRRDERRALLEAQYTHRANFRPGFQPGLPGPVMYGPGAPVFYGQQPGLNPQQRQPVFYPQGMVARPRWVQPQPGAQPRNASQPMPNYMGGVRQPRQNRRPQNPTGQVQQVNNKPQGQVPQQQGQPQGQPQQQQGQQGQPQGQNPQARRGYKYNPNARNRPDQAAFNTPMAPAMVIPAGAPGLLLQEPLNPTTLAQATPQQRKQMLGNRLYPLIQAQEPEAEAEAVGKITGMLLDAMDFGELLHLIESPAALSAKVQEALVVLQHAREGDEPAEGLDEQQ